MGNRVTIPLLLVVREIAGRINGEHYCTAIARKTGLPTGTVGPILIRLQERGWLRSRRERISPKRLGRPARRYYYATRKGEAEMEKLLQASKHRIPGSNF